MACVAAMACAAADSLQVVQKVVAAGSVAYATLQNVERAYCCTSKLQSLCK